MNNMIAGNSLLSTQYHQEGLTHLQNYPKWNPIVVEIIVGLTATLAGLYWAYTINSISHLGMIGMTGFALTTLVVAITYCAQKQDPARPSHYFRISPSVLSNSRFVIPPSRDRANPSIQRPLAHPSSPAQESLSENAPLKPLVLPNEEESHPHQSDAVLTLIHNNSHFEEIVDQLIEKLHLPNERYPLSFLELCMPIISWNVWKIHPLWKDNVGEKKWTADECINFLEELSSLPLENLSKAVKFLNSCNYQNSDPRMWVKVLKCLTEAYLIPEWKYVLLHEIKQMSSLDRDEIFRSMSLNWNQYKELGTLVECIISFKEPREKYFNCITRKWEVVEKVAHLPNALVIKLFSQVEECDLPILNFISHIDAVNEHGIFILEKFSVLFTNFSIRAAELYNKLIKWDETTLSRLYDLFTSSYDISRRNSVEFVLRLDSLSEEDSKRWAPLLKREMLSCAGMDHLFTLFNKASSN